MPELPEVESIRIQLEKFLVGSSRGGALRGHTIKKLEIRNPKYEIEKEKIENTKITGVRRFGKVLVIDLSDNYSIVTHIKMTGQFIYRGPNLKTFKKYPKDSLSSSTRSGICMDSRFRGNDKENENSEADGLSKKIVGGLGGKHTHVIFHLDRGGILYFNDYRRFGWMRVEKTSNIQNSKNPNNYIGKLGKEFLKDLTPKDFSEMLSKSKKPIKVLLMDQTKMAGVGNIYANDALWLAKVKPTKESKKLRNEEVRRLFMAVETVLKEAIRRGGASELAFVTPDGGEGKYQDFTLVYGREKEPCKNCKTPIEKIKLGGRGTYFCPVCQK